jgi:hypothetical protein
MKINRFEQSVCGLQTVAFRGQSKTAHNSGLAKGRLTCFVEIIVVI